MKTKLLILAVLLLMLGSSVLATNTRVRTMGNNNMIVLDDYNIVLFPSRLNDYPNLVIGEFAGDDFYEMGVHWSFNKDNPWVLGTYISTPMIGRPTGYYDGSSFGNFTESFWTTDKRIDLYYGRQNFPGTHSFGMHFGYTRASNDYSDTTIAYKEKYYVYDFGFGITNAAKDYDAAVNIQFGGWTDELAGSNGLVETEPDGFMEVSALARHFKSYGDYTTICHAEVGYGKRGEKDHVIGDGDPATTDDMITKDTRVWVDLGYGVNWTPASNVLVVGDVGLALENNKRETTPSGGSTTTLKNNMLYFPYWSIGLDADVFKWMDIRLGATSDWVTRKAEWPGAEQKDKFASNDTYLGFGFHWGRLHVDTETDPDLFLRGFNFISGAGYDGNDMNTRISIVYEIE